MKKLFLISLLIITSTKISAQFTEFHPELEWYTIKSGYVEVHFHQGAERTAQVVAKIANEVWGPITSLYEYEPSTVHYIIKDIDDYSNGATYFFDNKIEIWTSALDFDLRGTHNWLRNVISHEFTHLVQIQAAMKLSRSVPAFFLQILNYQQERRPDILYGYPNYVVSYPIATVNVPAWFAEGTAQYMRTEFDYDNWDTHRDMILRSYALDGNMLTWNEMGVFGKTSLGNESVYNSGFALTRYISQKYGEDKLRELTEQLGVIGNFTMDNAMEVVLGKSGDEVYEEWKTFLIESYTQRTVKVRENLAEGEIITEKGFGNFYPDFNNEGTKIYYVSNKSSDYFSPSSIYEYDIETKKEKTLVGGVRSTYSWLPGQNKILYSKITEDNPEWYNVHDLFVYDFDLDEEFRLTYNLRANQPNVSHDGKKVVFLFQKDGTTNLGTIEIDLTNEAVAKNFKALTFFEEGEQVYNPKFSNDDTYIIFDYSYANTRNIARIDTSGANYKYILQTEHDERNPSFDQFGNIVYASDESGIFNIYSYNLNTKTKKQLTNVIGGAFMPSIDDKGNITYSGYTSSGYKIFLISESQEEKVEPRMSYVWLKNPPLDESKPNGDIHNFDLKLLRNYTDVYIDSNYATIVGQNGTILRTTNGGDNWIIQKSNISSNLYGVTYGDLINGTIVGENGTILKTTDGGKSWFSQSSGTTANLFGVSSINWNHIFAVGQNGTILMSTDGGEKWISQSSDTENQLWSVAFVNNSNGIIVGESGTILKTTNGGIDWINKSRTIDENLTGISFMDSINAIAVGENGTILLTTNGGNSWSIKSGETENNLWKISFSDEDNGIIVGKNGTLLQTTNGGKKWSSKKLEDGQNLLGVSFSDLDNAISVGESGATVRTSDGGVIWLDQSIGTEENLYDVYKEPELIEEKYSGAFSSLSFFPYIRFDNYNPENTFWERIKPGVYISSSDMLNRYAIFAGADVNIKLERDLFFIFEYKNKLPLLGSIGLYPELSAELYSTSRKADVDVFFGPDTVNGEVTYDQTIPTEVTYNLFEFDIAASHRIFNRFNDIEVRFIFSRYIATLGSFVIQTADGPFLYPTTDDTYFIGRNLRLSYNFSAFKSYKDANINPIGLEVDFVYDYEWNKFNNEGQYEIEDGLLVPVYNDYDFNRLFLDIRYSFELWGDNTMATRLAGGTILGPAVPDFFDFYIGGLIGVKAYPFYSLAGNEFAWIDITYRFPLWQNIDIQWGMLYFDKIFLSFNFDYADAWTGDFPGWGDFKKGAGAEIRLHMNSYYLFPTAVFFNASYGFDQFDQVYDGGVATYGKEWNFYGGILFGFEIVNNRNKFRDANGFK